jgi:hypothetical protein
VTALTPKHAVSIVLKAIEEKLPDRQITESLVFAGASPADAPMIVCSVREGFKSGVQSKVIGMREHQNDDPYYSESFAIGRCAVRFRFPGWLFIWMITFYLFGVTIVAYLIWRFLR